MANSSTLFTSGASLGSEICSNSLILKKKKKKGGKGIKDENTRKITKCYKR